MNIIQSVLGYKKIFSIFPELYNYREFSPFIIRIAIALTLIALGWKYFSKRAGWKTINTLMGIADILTGAALLFAVYTQLAALASSVIFLFYAVTDYRSENKQLLKYHLLLAAISVSLLFSGPGVFAFDLPL